MAQLLSAFASKVIRFEQVGDWESLGTQPLLPEHKHILPNKTDIVLFDLKTIGDP